MQHGPRKHRFDSLRRAGLCRHVCQVLLPPETVRDVLLALPRGHGHKTPLLRDHAGPARGRPAAGSAPFAAVPVADTLSSGGKLHVAAAALHEEEGQLCVGLRLVRSDVLHRPQDLRALLPPGAG